MAPTPSSTDLDDLRLAHPSIGFALYAIEPGGPVTLETYTPDGEVFSFPGLTARAAIDAAFPSPPPSDVFD